MTLGILLAVIAVWWAAACLAGFVIWMRRRRARAHERASAEIVELYEDRYGDEVAQELAAKLLADRVRLTKLF